VPCTEAGILSWRIRIDAKAWRTGTPTAVEIGGGRMRLHQAAGHALPSKTPETPAIEVTPSVGWSPVSAADAAEQDRGAGVRRRRMSGRSRNRAAPLPMPTSSGKNPAAQASGPSERRSRTAHPASTDGCACLFAESAGRRPAGLCPERRPGTSAVMPHVRRDRA
jgi:hypothetical protein